MAEPGAPVVDAPRAERSAAAGWDRRLRGLLRAAPSTWAVRALAAAGLTLVLVLYGFVPGSSQVPLTSLSGAGAIQCLHDQGVASLWTWCMSLGLPVGAPRLTGLPQVYAGWLLTFLPGVDAWDAHQLSSAAFVATSFVAGLLLLRRWGVPAVARVLGTVAYLVAPNVLELNGFEYTFLGFALLPAYVLGALAVLDLVRDGRFTRGALGCLGLCLLMVFTEGYSFFGAGVVIAVLVLSWAWRRLRVGERRAAVGGVVVWCAAAGAAVAAYVAWVPADAFETGAGLETFAFYGVDVVSLLVPTATFLVPALLGWAGPELGLWGTSASLDVNHLGYLALALAAVALGTPVLARRSARRAAAAAPAGAAPRATSGDGDAPVPRADEAAAELRAVALAGVVTLLLSLGPVLKVGQTTPEMAAAVAGLPSAWLYEHVPGFSEMRAVHRWLVPTRWAVVVLATVGVSHLWRRARRSGGARPVAVVLLGLTALVEIAPDVRTELVLRERSVERVAFLRDGLVAEAETLVEDGETVLLLPKGNDFLANYLVPMIGARSFNVGVDKNWALSAASWPESVVRATAAADEESARGICRALRTDVDAVVLPYVSPFYGPLLWGNDRAAERELERVARWLAEDERFDAEVGEWLTVLRPSGSSCTSP